MFSALKTSAARSLPLTGRRAFCNYTPFGKISTDSAKPAKVAVLGATGGIGQPLSLLLKINPYVTDLALYDIRGAPGMQPSFRHLKLDNVKGYEAGEAGLKATLEGADIVLVPAGVPRKPGMTRDDLFNTNASIANMLIISNPINSTVPIVAEIFKSRGVYNPKRLFGVTTLDVVRASRFIGEVKGSDPANHNITVVGGHSGVTIVPLLSQQYPEIVGETRDALTHRIQFGGDEVVKAKDGAGSATLSMAFAGARMANAILRARAGETGLSEPAFVESPLFKDQGVSYFASEIEFGQEGVKTIRPLPKTNEYENNLIQTALKDLKANINKGIEFVKNNP
ncbi:malate dehydrogenase, NAD-dependent [Kalaharituber pfeilii]|nr:malate dehydrogenase, NAD-dependent [Kalaharituber pfeilii]